MGRISQIEQRIASVPQVQALVTSHTLHAGMYARTVRLPQSVVGTGTVIKIATLLIVHGDVDLLTDDGWLEVRGYGVFAGEPGRKQMFLTHSPVEMTMIFPTAARTVNEAEREFTDEFEQLMSRKAEGRLCQE